MNLTQQTAQSRPSLTAVPSPTPEIEAEMNKLRDSVERVSNRFSELASRLHSVRASEPIGTGEATAKESEATTPLGSQIRALRDHLETVTVNIDYHLRTVALS